MGRLSRARAGLKYVLVCLDVYSKYVIIYPLKNSKKKSDYLKNHSQPGRIQCDHSVQLTNPKWTEKLKKEEIKCPVSSIRYPDSKVVEQYKKEWKRLLRSSVDDKHTA